MSKESMKRTAGKRLGGQRTIERCDAGVARSPGASRRKLRIVPCRGRTRMTRRKFALLSGAAVAGAYGGIKLQKVQKPAPLSDGPAAPSAAVVHPTSQIKRGAARTAQPKRRNTRRVARADAGGDCCQSGWSDNAQTSPNAMSRRRAASRGPTDWPALAGN